MFDSLANEAYRQASRELPLAIQALQASGRYPDSSEMASIQSELRELEDQAHHAREKVQEMTSHLLVLEEKLDRYRALSSPIRRLPPEILSVIFAHAVEKISFGQVEYKACNAITLSMVSSHWRRVCLDTPVLWSHVSIGADITQHGAASERLLLFLTRSKDVPLTYDLCLAEDRDHRTSRLLSKEIAYALFGDRGRAKRLRHLSLKLGRGGWPVARLLAGAFGDQLEGLRGLEVKMDYDAAKEAFRMLRLVLVELPWNQITALILTHADAQIALIALEALPSLSTAEITLEWYHGTASPELNQPPINMAFLSTLIITVNRDHNSDKRSGFRLATSILDGITTPVMSDFTLVIEGSRKALSLTTAGALVKFLARSAPPDLQAIKIRGLFPTAVDSKHQPIFDSLPEHLKELLRDQTPSHHSLHLNI
ncbi:hypothetical protein V5O48_008835 [Marasmius crinis-equi]|uniref:F-box domain-containing protein n=1 Tax=Marasmius crinis-equi TaxID=585013 RepID=A0ABR3FCY3_9AGAR